MHRILVTGGSRGIGAAVARGAAARGWAVALSYRADRAAAETVVRGIAAAGGQALAMQADVTDEDDLARIFDEAEAGLGGLDCVVANAGIVAPSMPLIEMDVARLRRMIDTNLLGALLTAREAARRLGDGGSLVLVSSAAARLGSPFEYVDYAATKGAVDALTLGLAKELAGQGVRVNAVRPGVIDTDIHASGGQPGRAARLAPSVPMQRPGRAEEVAEAILWLCGDGASYCTGTVMDVAGGR